MDEDKTSPPFAVGDIVERIGESGIYVVAVVMWSADRWIVGIENVNNGWVLYHARNFGLVCRPEHVSFSLSS